MREEEKIRVQNHFLSVLQTSFHIGPIDGHTSPVESSPFLTGTLTVGHITVGT